MGIVWEAYHKGVPLLGVPENPTEPRYASISMFQTKNQSYSGMGLTLGKGSG